MLEENTTQSAAETSKNTKHANYLLQAWLVILFSALFGVILVTVQISLGAKIDANKKQATFAQIPALVSDADPSKTQELSIVGSDGKPARIYQVFDASGKHIGWVFPGNGQGFGDAITLIIGLNSEADTLTGLYVLDQKETPGLGNFIQSEDFCTQFNGKNVTSPLSASAGEPTDPQQVKAVTGATISSKAVCDIVNETVSKYRAAALAASR